MMKEVQKLKSAFRVGKAYKKQDVIADFFESRLVKCRFRRSFFLKNHV